MEIKLTIVRDGKNNDSYEFGSYEQLVDFASSRVEVAPKKAPKKRVVKKKATKTK